MEILLDYNYVDIHVDNLRVNSNMDLHYITIPEIDKIMLDYTSKCNALCLRCARNIDGKYLNKVMPIADMPWDTFEKFMTPVIDTVNMIEYCGNYGDAPLHPDLIKSIDWITNKQNIKKRIKNNRLRLAEIEVATNGGINDPGWWAELAQVMNKKDSNNRVDFGFDGLEDTNHIYRRQVKWEKCMENSKAFIKAGGKAWWQFIIFDHKKHQIKEAKSIAFDMGFKTFFTISGYGNAMTYYDIDKPDSPRDDEQYHEQPKIVAFESEFETNESHAEHGKTTS